MIPATLLRVAGQGLNTILATLAPPSPRKLSEKVGDIAQGASNCQPFHRRRGKVGMGAGAIDDMYRNRRAFAVAGQ